MSANHAEFEELCAAFSLGALDGAEREKLRAHLPTCSACRQRVAEFEESATWLALGLTPITPSADVKRAVMQRISGQHGQAGRDGAAGGGGLLYLALGLAGLALLSAGGLGWLYAQASRDLDARTQERDALESEKDRLEARLRDLEGVQARLRKAEERVEQLQADLARSEDARRALAKDYDAARRELDRLRPIVALLEHPETRHFALKDKLDPSIGEGFASVLWRGDQVALIGEKLPPLPPGKAYELWAIDGGGAQPAGVFDDLSPDGSAAALQRLTAAPRGADRFAITIEPAGGSTTPTPPVLLISPEP